jgi:hypothetical protein
MVAGPEGEEAPSAPSAEVGRPVGTKEIPQESDATSGLYSRKNIQNVVYSTEGLRNSAYASMRKYLKKKRLNKAEKILIDELCEAVIVSEEQDGWQSKIEECIADKDKIEELGALEGVQDISIRHGLSLYSAALLYHGD